MNSRILGALGVSMLVASLQAQRVDTILSTNLSGPQGITSDGTSAYITDSGNNRVVMYSQEGVLTTLAGVTGANGNGYKDGIGTRAMFSDPQAIVYSAARNGLIVADYGNSAIRFIDLTPGVATYRNVTTIAGVGTQDGYYDGPQGTSLYSFPSGVDVDTNTGNIYVADFGNGYIRQIDSSNNTTLYMDLGSVSPSGVSQPTAVAVGSPGELWVADSYNYVIWHLTTNASGVSAACVAGQFQSMGTNDAAIGTQGNLSGPWGVLWRSWLGPNADLIVSDTGNNTLRRLYYNTNADVLDYSLTTFSGSPGVAGLADGMIPNATFNRPMGLGLDPINYGFYIADSANSCIRMYSDNSVALTRVPNPSLGYVTYLINPNTGSVSVIFNDLTGQSKTFNNFPLIACMESDKDALVDFTYGPPPLGSLNDPTAKSPTALELPSGATPADVPASLPCVGPDMFIKAFALRTDGSPPSAVVNAEFLLQVATPLVSGQNAADLSVSDETTNATIYYTLDGTEPTTSSSIVGTTTGSGTTLHLALSITVDTQLKLKAFDNADNFTPSQTTVMQLQVANYQANQLVWGLASGVGASQFMGSPGQTFYAPIALVELAGQSIYAFQFDAWILTATNALTPSGYNFRNDLLQYVNSVYEYLPPNEFVENLVATNLVLNSDGTTALTTNVSSGQTLLNYVNSLEVGWLTYYPLTNYYPTPQQDLVMYSAPYDVIYSANSTPVMGSVEIAIPSNALLNSPYQIQLQNGSGIDIGSQPIPMQTVTNGSLTGGSVNSIKQLAVNPASPKYLVGSIQPFYWFNAGEFGTNTIASGDVIQTFETAAYYTNSGYLLPSNCDMFNAMDSSSGVLNTNWDNDPQNEIISINNMTMGDGVVGADDLYVTFRRSLDPSLNWYNRYWTNGALTNELTPNLLAVPGSFVRKARALDDPAPPSVSSGPHSVTVCTSTLIVSSNQTLAVPINAAIIGSAPIRTMLFNITVEALDGSPAITSPVSFGAADNLATPNQLTLSKGPNNIAMALLDPTVTGVYGTNQIGTVLVNLPTNTTPLSAYLIHFNRFFASPNGLTMFSNTVGDTLLTLSDRSGSSWNDGISDAWRLLYFGSVSNQLSAANADPAGDGVSNLQKFQAGINPMAPLPNPAIQPPDPPTLILAGMSSDPVPAFTLQWFGETGHTYVVESSPDLTSTNWTMISSNLPGNDAMTQFSDTNATASAMFYRVLAQ